VDLCAAYLHSTLASKASKRLSDAIEIVANLKEMLEDPRFADSRYRAQSDDNRVKAAHAGLTAMLKAMEEHAKRISFEGVLVEEPAKQTGQRGGTNELLS